MPAIEKKIKKFLNNPKNTKYPDFINILLYFGFEKIYTKGNHVKFKHHSFLNDFVIPVHNNECKDFYKLEAGRLIKKLKNLR